MKRVKIYETSKGYLTYLGKDILKTKDVHPLQLKEVTFYEPMP
jgi:hypothetical protein